MDPLSDTLTAVSHPSRRAILRRLQAGPARFTDVAKPLDVSLNAVTKHLKLLERAGLITRTRRGREVFITMQAEPLRQVSRWVRGYEEFWNERLDKLEAHFRERRRRKT